jgi:hypothetical protein
MTKISNITKGTNFPKDIIIPLVDGNSLTLKPGEFLFVENLGNNSILRVYEKKQIISITQEEKPDSLSYSRVYNNLDLIRDKSKNLEEAHEILREQVINDERFPRAIREEFANIKETIINQDLNQEKEEEITIEIIVPEGSIKNKGGRPKGSVKKEKRGRPKKKGTPGRPKKRGRPAKRKK